VDGALGTGHGPVGPEAPVARRGGRVARVGELGERGSVGEAEALAPGDSLLAADGAAGWGLREERWLVRAWGGKGIAVGYGGG